MDKPKSILHILLWLILILIFFSCSPKPYALYPEAIPMKQDGDRVLGVFSSLEGSPERYHAQWFYFPGQGLIDPTRTASESS
jgi:hypothetical protein